MKRFSKVSFDDIKTIQVDSGVLLKEFDVENPVFLPENVICVTSGGINPVCAPEYYDFGEDVDNAKTAKETKRIRGWNVSISFTTFTTSLDLIRLALGAADISGKVLSIRQKLQYAKDFKDIWWVGERADGIIVAIKLIRSLSDSGFSLQTRKGGKGQISVTLKGHSSFAEPNKIPIEVYIFAENDIPILPDEPDTPTASMYLYGRPSESGNIGLRVGDSVTYYDGAVLPPLPEWDKTKYPYAFIVEYEANVMGAHYRTANLYAIPKVEHFKVENGNWCVSIANYMESEIFVSLSGSATATDYVGKDWGAFEEKTASGVVVSEIDWANFDVLNEDGSVHRAKSDPIPVGEIVDYINDIPIYEVI